MTAYADSNKGACNTCHADKGAGAMGPNISGSKTSGIGNWTEPQFHEAVRNAKNRKGASLCALMLAFPANLVSDQDIADIYAYLIANPVETAMAGSYCTDVGCNKACTGTAQ